MLDKQSEGKTKSVVLNSLGNEKGTGLISIDSSKRHHSILFTSSTVAGGGSMTGSSGGLQAPKGKSYQRKGSTIGSD